MPPDEFKARIVADMPKWAKVIHDAGIRPALRDVVRGHLDAPVALELLAVVGVGAVLDDRLGPLLGRQAAQVGKAYFIRRYGSQTKVGKRLGNDTPEEGADYAGRGDVQITGETNYEKAEAALREFYPEIVAEFERRTGKRFDLTVGDQPDDKRDPDNAMDPAIAYAIMSFGMRTGMFTDRKSVV